MCGYRHFWIKHGAEEDWKALLDAAEALMGRESDRSYYLKREWQCRRAAMESENPAVSRVHRCFAERYQEAAASCRVAWPLLTLVSKREA